MNGLDKLLWRKGGRWQRMGASAGVFIGLFLLLLAVQVFLDMRLLLEGARDANVLVINKDPRKHAGKSKEFSPEEVEKARQQSFFSDLSVFKSNQYTVSLEVSQIGFYAQTFFQSIPNRFLDVDTAQFTWKEGDRELPIILSSDYLALYNFAFAPSQGLPTFTPETIGLLELDVTVAGKGNVMKLKGFIYDVSRNINSILVPPAFMEYANRAFGDRDKQPSQLIASTNNPYNRSLNDFLEKEGYELSRGGLIGGELKSAMQLLLLLVVVIGLIILGLSSLVFILNFQLLIAQATEDIRWLIQLGYPDGVLTRFLAKRLLFLLAIAFVLACLSIVPIKYTLSAALIEQGYDRISVLVSLPVWLLAAGLCAVLMFVNWRSIQKNVRKLA